MELDLENPLPTKTIQSLFIAESDQYPSQNTEPNTHLRRELVSQISLLSSNFDYSVSYLAINYLDRFLFTQTIPKGNPWALRLMAVSCVSLALKMFTKAESSVSDIQRDGGFIFDTQTICRMEKMILAALKWRMRSVTPFSFVNFFIALFKFKDPPHVQSLKARATEIIFKAQNDGRMLEFKPSLISATALLCASNELFPLQFPCFKDEISKCEYVNKEKVYICYKMMEEIAMDEPLNVLDLHFNSTTTTATSCCSEDNKKHVSEEEEEEEKVMLVNMTLDPETKRSRKCL